MTNIRSWGLINKLSQKTTIIDDKFINLNEKYNIPFGNGRSYGDSCLSNNHLIKRNKFIKLNQNSGILECSSNILLIEALSKIVPKGWIFYVCPGTSLATVGGMISADAHGKNHEKYGSFTNCVKEITVMHSEEKEFICSKNKNADLFYATCGGLGLTGFITSCKLQLRKIKTTNIRSNSIKFFNLKNLLDKFDKDKNEFKVAWIDGLNFSNNYKIIYESANFCEKSNELIHKKIKQFQIKFFPTFLLNAFFIKIFNWLYFNLKKESNNICHIYDFLFNLDKIKNWNKFYGNDGFLQYQFVVPNKNSYLVIIKLFKYIENQKLRSYLIVIKKFGRNNMNYLSFPVQGLTVSLDLKMNLKNKQFINDFQKSINKYGAHVYLAKDSSLNKKIFKDSYNLQKFNKVRKKYNLNNYFNSHQSLRLDL